MVVIIVGCPSEAEAVANAVDIDMWRDNIEKMNESELFGAAVWGDGRMLCKVEKSN